MEIIDIGMHNHIVNNLKKENKNLKIMFDEVHDNELETREKKNEILKWAYSLEKSNAELNECLSIMFKQDDKRAQEIHNLEKENKLLKQERDYYDGRYRTIAKAYNNLLDNTFVKSEQGNYMDYGILKQENEKLKQELSDVTKVKDHFAKQAYDLKQDYKTKIDDMKSLSDENDIIRQDLYNKFNKVIELQMQLYDARVKEARLSQILNETS